MSREALKAALTMVDPSKIEVVHVTVYPSTVEPGVVWGTITEDTLAENLQKSFAESCEEAGLPSVSFTTEFGDPGSKICEIAKSSDAGLIIISSHGRTGLNRLLIGSVAERVVRLAPCAVLGLRNEPED